MWIAPSSIGRKLLFSFITMAMLVFLSALIGVSGFSFVAKTERNVVDTALPAMIEARQVSELSNRIIASVQTLSNAKNEDERRQAGKLLFEQLASLLSHIKQLGADSFDSELLIRLEQHVQSVIDNLAQLGVTVEKKLWLAKEVEERVADMRQLSGELEQLTRTQVLNTSTIAVANVTHIYDLLEQGEREQVLNALDTLVEVDMDLSERLHELHLLAFKMRNQIEEARTLTNAERIVEVQQAFNDNLSIMQRRVQAVEDPTRSQQMVKLLEQLSRRQVVFTILLRRYENDQQSQALMQENLDLFNDLNNTVNTLVDESNRTTREAVDELTQTLHFAQLSLTIISLLGLIVVAFIVWRVVYVSVVKRLTEYSAALLSVAQGRLDVQLTVKGNDELAQMGSAIITAQNTARELNIVAEGEARAKRELEQHKTHLEELVMERTGQLQLANQKLNHEVLNHAKARAEAEQANRAKSAFLATMSHEIRTPMNGVLGTAQLLQDSGLNKQQARYAEIINRSGKNLLAILNDVLDYSKIEAGHLAIRESDFDLKVMVEDTFDLMQSRASEKQLGFSYHIESDVPRFWRGDVTRISQVLNNLVGNAIKFTQSGEVDIYVSLDPDASHRVRFEVSDTGIGIAKQDLADLFEAFTQAEGGQQYGGTGLGLAISRQIIEKMGGRLDVDSQVDEGSRFWFSVPLKMSESIEVRAEERHESEHNLSAANVLLVEDNPVNRFVAEGFLKVLGHKVFIAENGAEAESLVKSNTFDIALVDINLPDCNGVDLIQRLKQHEGGLKPMPMIAVSAHVFNEDVQGYLDSGFDGYLPKPLEKEALNVALNRALSEQSVTQLEAAIHNTLNQAAVQVISPLNDMTSSDALQPSTDFFDTPEITDTAQVIDITVLKNDINILGVEKMTQIVELFATTSQQTVHELEAAEQQQDASQVKALAHKLKGSAGSLGLVALQAMCQRIESAQQPLQTYGDGHAELVAVLDESIVALHEVLVKS